MADNRQVTMIDEQSEPDDDEYDGPSKSQRKRDADKLFDLARDLCEVSAKRLKILPLNSDLVEAIVACKAIKAHGARKRQLQYLAKLLRKAENSDELLEINADFETWQRRNQATASPKKIATERNKEICKQLLTDTPEGIETLLETYPTINIQRVRQLVRNARKTLTEEGGVPPGKHVTALHSLLNEHEEPHQ